MAVRVIVLLQRTRVIHVRQEKGKDIEWNSSIHLQTGHRGFA